MLELLGPKRWWGKRKLLGLTPILANDAGDDPEALQREVDWSATFLLEEIGRDRRSQDAIDSLIGTYYEDER